MLGGRAEGGYGDGERCGFGEGGGWRFGGRGWKVGGGGIEMGGGRSDGEAGEGFGREDGEGIGAGPGMKP